jgi:heptosyltransferase II
LVNAEFMLVPLINLAGWILARTPEPALRVLSAVLGDAVLLLARGRRRLILSNLHHAFPDKPRGWQRRTARLCCHRFVETGMLSLATPFLSERRIRRIARLAPSVEQWARNRAATGRATVFGTLHLALWESQTWLKLLSPVPLPEFGIIFRPLDNPQADAFVKRTRERFGMRLLSRKQGFADAARILREGGCVGVLFDQNAGMQGALTLLLGRVCSTSELPGLLACKFGAELRTFHPRRTGFWRVSFESDPIPHDGTAAGATFGLNRWLEDALSDDDLCASWLWVHDRWRHQDVPARRLRLSSKRDLLAADVASRGLPALPRRTRIWVRMPNWLGDVAIALPLLRAIRRSRPDAALTLVARAQFLPLLAGWGVAEELIPLPDRGPGYFPRFASLGAEYPDTWILFTNSLRGDLEAWLAGCPQRFGILRPGKSRPLLTHAYRVPDGFDEAARHQIEFWRDFLVHFGLEGEPDRTPLSAAPASGPIGLIPGSENTPAKRWPVGHWRRLIEDLPGESFVIFGTAADRDIARRVAAGFEPRVEDRAGRTSLAAFSEGLAACRLVVTNDTGGMHLANALGIPVVALFGPTNPIRTGPIFDAPRTLLQPPGCPPTGGAPLDGLQPGTVAQAVTSFPWPSSR